MIFLFSPTVNSFFFNIVFSSSLYYVLTRFFYFVSDDFILCIIRVYICLVYLLYFGPLLYEKSICLDSLESLTIWLIIQSQS